MSLVMLGPYAPEYIADTGAPREEITGRERCLCRQALTRSAIPSHITLSTIEKVIRFQRPAFSLPNCDTSGMQNSFAGVHGIVNDDTNGIPSHSARW